MKKMTTAILAFAILFASCGSSGNQKMGNGKSIDISPDKLSVKIDPVCQMRIDQHPIADTATYQGKLYGFCSTGCKEAFVAEPDKFLADLPK